MGVEDIVTIYSFSCCCIITCYWFFFYSVIDQLSFFFILLKICKTVCPVSICIWCYFLRVHFCSICKKVDSDCTRADAVLVVAVIPGLGSTDRCCFISIDKFCTVYCSTILLDNLIKSQSSIAIVMSCYAYSSGGYCIIYYSTYIATLCNYIYISLFRIFQCVIDFSKVKGFCVSTFCTCCQYCVFRHRCISCFCCYCECPVVTLLELTACKSLSCCKICASGCRVAVLEGIVR